MKLYTYQEELVNSKSDRIMINWCRGAGKTTGVMAYILENRPSKVLLDYKTFMGIELYLERNELEGVKIAKTLNRIYLVHSTTNFTTTIESERIHDNIDTERYDLVVCDSTFDYDYDIKSKKVIKVLTQNVYSYTNSEKEIYRDYEVIEVDYKDASKEDAVSIDKAVEFAKEDSDKFYNQFAIKDKPKKQKVSFESFKEDALQRLQQQFLGTSNTKDTVLTRKNILEMIKDLIDMGNTHEDRKPYTREVTSSRTGDKYSITLTREIKVANEKPEAAYEVHVGGELIKTGFIKLENIENRYEKAIGKIVDNLCK